MYYGEPPKTRYDLRFERVGEPDVEVPRTVEIEHGVRTVTPLGLTWMNGLPLQFQLNDISTIDSRPFLSNRPLECHPGLHPEVITLDHMNSIYDGEDATTVYYPITHDGKIDVMGDDGKMHTLQLRFLYLTGERAIESELECPFPRNSDEEIALVETGTQECPPLRLVA